MANWPSNARQQMCQWSRPSDFIGDQRNILRNDKFLIIKWKWSKLWPWELKPTSERLLPWLLQREEVKVLHLVRDPRYFFFFNLCFSALVTNNQFRDQFISRREPRVNICVCLLVGRKNNIFVVTIHYYNTMMSLCFCPLSASHCHENMI